MIAGLSKDNYEPPKSSRLVPAIRHKGTTRNLQRNYKELTRNLRDIICPLLTRLAPQAPPVLRSS